MTLEHLIIVLEQKIVHIKKAIKDKDIIATGLDTHLKSDIKDFQFIVDTLKLNEDGKSGGGTTEE